VAALSYLVRFFRVVPTVSPLMTTTFAVLTLVVSVAAFLNPAEGSTAFAPILLLQGFAAASGFAAPARRG
jgi:hypothetical protein